VSRARSRLRSIVVACASAAAATCAYADNPAEVLEMPTVDVVGTTPLPGLGTPLRDVPANVQIFGSRALQRQRTLTLTQFLDLNANSVSAASGQGNPFQESVDFRGFAASPLLGTPQGISVFQDGVRINEAFGDVVNWDLVPRAAISSVQLIPGSVAAFGLNTLGGALAIYTKSGAQYPGTRVEASGGSFGRAEAEVEHGGRRDHVDWFATAHVSDDHGWAEHNPSRVRQLFGKVGYQDDVTDLDVSTTLADNTLEGTQTLPLSMSANPRQAYTFPDRNANRLAFLAAKGSRFLADDVLLGGNAYVRRYRSENVSSNVNDDFEADRPDSSPAFNDRSDIDQRSGGGGVQLTVDRDIDGFAHRIAIGVSVDAGSTRFSQSEQPAKFTADRGTIAAGPYALHTDVTLRNASVGAFVTDTIRLASAWSLTVSGRYDRARVRIEDRTGEDDALNGEHAFSRLNPAVGVTWTPSPALTVFATYNEGMRAPTPIELTCADPAAPCKLPNQFLADPPLAKVVSRTAEMGARGSGAGWSWSAALYHTDLVDDLQFIASGTGAGNAGFFRNVGPTRRQGVELAASRTFGAVTLTARYNHLDATFRSAFSASSPNHSDADANGAIEVRPGNRIPGLPRDALKLRAEWRAGERLEVGMSVAAVSSQYARGDENNRDIHGPLPGYAVTRLDLTYPVTPQWELFALVDNLFDRKYATFGLLGANVFTGPDGSFGPAVGAAPVAEQFRAYGAPRGAFVGVRYAFEAER
jgi:outer membrane receptor protein involved in Fe transport